ncbi:MAG: serine/threonine protein phosphatase [Hungatella sp.]|nr:serine/threonine protein phosphatase [Hungatella sp.]
MTPLTFGLFSDLHLDIMQDGQRRLALFLRDCQKRNVDFVITAGDFTYPQVIGRCLCSEKNLPINLKNAMTRTPPISKMEILDQYNSFSLPHYHVLGNHEMDFSSKEEAVRLLGMPSPYYDFHHKGWHLIVLDANHYQDQEGRIRGYSYGNYIDFPDSPYLDEEQLSWLLHVLKASPEPAVIFSHQPLYPRRQGGGLRNYDEFYKILSSVTDHGFPRVKMCIYGHVHVDEYEIRDGILHYCINSISNHWVGPGFACQRFDQATEENFPNLRYTFPYRDPVYAIVTLTNEEIRILGRQSRFIPPTPQELHFRAHPVSPSVKNRRLRFNSGKLKENS